MMGYDKEEVIQAAASYGWFRVHQQTSPICEGTGSEFEGPCLNPGCPGGPGDDRFHRQVDFDELGGVYCRQCHAKNCRDGFDWIAKVNGLDIKSDFQKILQMVAEVVGVEPKNRRNKKSTKKQLPQQEGERLFKDRPTWSDLTYKYWDLHRPGITKVISREGIEKAGGVQSFHLSKPCIRIPIFGRSAEKASVFISTLGDWKPKNRDPISSRTLKGCKNGFSGHLPSGCRVLIKCEGYTDLLALLSKDLPVDVGVVSNAFGCSSVPKAKQLAEVAENIDEVWVVHDSDKPGQEGASKFAGAFANFAPTKNVVLPFDIQPKKGKDLRDFITEGNGFDEIAQLAATAELVEATEIDQAKSQKPIEEITDPDRLARIVIDNLWTDHQEQWKFWNDWAVWRNGKYTEATNQQIGAAVWREVKAEFDHQWQFEFEEYEHWKDSAEYNEDNDKGPPKVRKMSIPLQRNVIQALQTMVSLPADTQADTWLPTGENRSYMAMENGLFDLRGWIEGKPIEEFLLPHSPEWFSFTKSEFPFDPDATCPEWERFLSQIFTDEESLKMAQRMENADLIASLRKAAEDQVEIVRMFLGYSMTPETYLQKIVFMEGPSRSGKGTILKVQRRILGAASVASPTFSTLCSQFGLQNLIGKRLAMIADARTNRRTDLSIGLERLLSLSSADPVTIDVKGKSAFTSVLTIKIIIATNEIPKLTDSSGAFANRMICLSTPNCYLGREDFDLEKKLLAELPGIFMWELEGIKRLEADRDSFKQPEGTKDLHSELRDETSPMARFAKDCLVLMPESQTKVYTKQVHYCYQRWAKDEGEKSRKAASMSRELKRISPGIVSDRETTGEKPYFFRGLVINDHWQKLSTLWQRADDSKVKNDD